MVAAVALKAIAREKAGKGVARTLRRDEKVPAIIYGNGQAPLQIAVDRRELELEYQKGKFNNTLVDITVDGKTYRTLPKEVQLHPVTDRPDHVDFLNVADNSRVKVWVHVDFTNRDKSPGLKMGGVLNIVRHEVELYCTPKTIPTKLVANLEGLTIGDSVHISHIALPEGVVPTIRDRDFTVATVAGRTKEEDLSAPVVGAPMPGAEEAAGAEGAAAPAAAAKAGDKAAAAPAAAKAAPAKK
ncbi:MAG: 50S ribosomal protein L25/general stress protein Ctc [Alphaproteobacteria bacterium]|nr:50S ribosomal protein L25/general stress protein Ctc [Alphaproteobacteria bacterium]